MTRPRARRGLSAFDGHTELGLPATGGMIDHIGRPMMWATDRKAYAGVLHLPLPVGWKQSRICDFDAFFVSDDSGSMYGMGGVGDPHGVRRAVALSQVSLLRRGPKGSRVGVVHWGSDAPPELTLRLTDPRRHPLRVRQALAIPPSLGGTNLTAGLSRTGELMADSSRDRRQIVFVLTDGLADPDADVQHELGLLPPRSVHVLLIDRQNNCPPELEQAWRALPFGSFTRLDLDNKRLSWQAAEILASAVGLQMPSSPAGGPARTINGRR